MRRLIARRVRGSSLNRWPDSPSQSHDVKEPVGWAEREQNPSHPLASIVSKTPRCEDGESLAYIRCVVNRSSRDVVTADGGIPGGCVSQPLLQEAHEAGRQEAAIACRLLDRVVEPVVRRALHDAGAHEEIGLLQS